VYNRVFDLTPSLPIKIGTGSLPKERELDPDNLQ